jgi:hypothetical protein
MANSQAVVQYGKVIGDFAPKPMIKRDENASVIDMNFNLMNQVVRSNSDRLASLSTSITNINSAIGSLAVPLSASPSASVGLAAVNGSASTFMRSDAAPAISQAIVPTWSALHTFTLAPKVSAFAGGGAQMVVTDNVGQLGVQAIPSASVANPTATIGLSAVNGSASSAMRSDGAPALSQAIVPTWTGAHTFSTGIYPSYVTKGSITYLTKPKNTALVPFSSGDWTNSLVTFATGSITQTASGSANHYAYRTYSNFNVAGQGFYVKFKFTYQNTALMPWVGINDSTSSFSNMGCIRFGGGTTFVVGQPAGGGVVLTGSFSPTNLTTYTVYLLYYRTSSTNVTVTYRILDSSESSVLLSGTVNTTGSYSTTCYLGMFCTADNIAGQLLDVWTIGLDTDNGGGLLTGNSLFIYNELTGCMGINSLTPTYSLDVTGTLRVTDTVNFSKQTASRALFTDASSNVTTNATTGSGNVVMSAGPTLSGTITAAAANFSGTVALSGILKLSSATFSNANAVIAAGTTYLAQVGTMSASRTVTLPAASAYARGAMIIIADESGTCTATNTIVVTRAGSDTINGATTKTIGILGGYDVCILMSDGTSKWTVLSSI